jgi:hypothetical protein
MKNRRLSCAAYKNLFNRTQNQLGVPCAEVITPLFVVGGDCCDGSPASDNVSTQPVRYLTLEVVARKLTDAVCSSIHA